MICYLVTEAGNHTMVEYLDTWGETLRDRVTVVTYESVFRRDRIPRADTYIYSDLERLTPGLMSAALALREMLEAQTAPPRLLNHPGRTLRRYALLRMLHERGINRFKARRVSEGFDDMTYPVFIRGENDHDGNRTALLNGPDELRPALNALWWRGISAQELLVTEFCDTADDTGLYRKYAAFIVGREVIARHLLFGETWMLKVPQVSEEHITTRGIDRKALADEQMTYVRSNPHAEQLRAIAADAGVEFGRIDYGLHDGRIQVWEINTNPAVLHSPSSYRPINLPTHELFARRIRAAFESLDGSSAGELTLQLPAHLRRGILRDRFGHYLRRRRRRLLRWYHHSPLMRWTVPATVRAHLAAMPGK